jgi:2,5-diamino-6-(ribosylamino)-4(3H)-pyrimidinone 5'-phosphate reductase
MSTHVRAIYRRQNKSTGTRAKAVSLSTERMFTERNLTILIRPPNPESATESGFRARREPSDMRVVVNTAMSADGKLSSRRREQIAISGPDDFDRVDALRAESDAVMVGVGTVLADDPHLTLDDPERQAARKDRGESAHPARVVADSRVRTPTDARILDDAATTYVLVSAAAPEEQVEQLKARGARVVTTGEKRVELSEALAELEGEGVEQVMVEGGGELIFSLFESELIDELRVFVGSMVVGGREAPTLADGEGFVAEFPELELSAVERVDDGVLLQYTVI